MASNLTVEDCFALLRKLYPIRRLIHVGDSGKHILSEYAEWTLASAIFVISEEDHHKSQSPIIESHAGWRSILAVLAESASERDYFKASNPRESGLLAPESLAGIWRNIKTLSRHRVLTKTLDLLLESLPVDTPQANWIVVNCLPALSVLQGATSCLDKCDVLVARAVLDQSLSTDTSSALSALDDYLTGRGFRRVSVREERHPALGSAIFVRDWRGFVLETKKAVDAERAAAVTQSEEAKRLIEGLTADRGEQIHLTSQHSSELDQAVRESGENAGLAEDRQRQLDQLTLEHDRAVQELAAQRQLASDRERLVAQITSDRVEQTRITNQRSSELEQAVRECSEKARLAEDRQRQLDQLALEHDRAVQELAAQRQLASDRERLVAQIASERDEQTRVANQRYKEREQAVRECGEKARLAEERRLQLDQLKIEHSRIAQELDAELQVKSNREASIAQITADRDEQMRVASQRSSELEQTVRECGEKARFAEDRQRQLDQLTIERGRIAQELAAGLQIKAELEASVAQITADRDEQTHLANQRYKEREQAVRESVEKTRLAEDCQRQLDQLTIEHSRIAQELDAELQVKSNREASIAQITADRDEQTRLANQRSSELEQAVRESVEKVRLAEERQRQLDQLKIEHGRIAQELDAELQVKSNREASIAQITADRDEQTRLSNQRHKEREQTLLERDTHSRLAHELKLQVEQLSRAGDQGAQELSKATEKIAALSLDLNKSGERIAELQSALEKQVNSRDKEFAELVEVRMQLERLNATAEERAARIKELEGGRDDLQARQVRLDREILKAEAQIDLIKDVILRDKAF